MKTIIFFLFSSGLVSAAPNRTIHGQPRMEDCGKITDNPYEFIFSQNKGLFLKLTCPGLWKTLTGLLEVKGHPHPSHGKCPKNMGAVELSWIQTLYCLLHIVHFPLVKQSELDLLIDTAEDRYFRSRKDYNQNLKYFSILGQKNCTNHQTSWSRISIHWRNSV